MHFFTIMFTEALCDFKYELFAFVKAWEFLSSWAIISFRKKTAPYAYVVSVQKITFRVLCWQFCFLLCHLKRFPQSLQGSSTWSQIRTIKHKIVLLTCKTRVTKWFTRRTLFICLVRMLRNLPLYFAKWQAMNMLLWQRYLCPFKFQQVYRSVTTEGHHICIWGRHRKRIVCNRSCCRRT